MPGTLASLAIVLGVDTTQVTTGVAKAKSELTGLVTSSEGANNSLANVAKTGIAIGAGFVAVAAGLGYLAIKFESETAHIAASMDVSQEKADEFGDAFLANAGKTIYSANDMIETFSTVAGQLDTINGKVVTVAQGLNFENEAASLAEATNSDLGDATSETASILQNFQLGLSSSATAANILFNVSKNLGMSVTATGDTLEKMRGRLGTAGLSLTDTGTLMEIMATHSLTGQRNINLFTGAINQLMSSAANPAALAKAQSALATAEAKLQSVGGSGITVTNNTAAAQRTLAVAYQRSQLDAEKYTASVAKNGATSIAAQGAAITLASAQNSVLTDQQKVQSGLASSQTASAAAANRLHAAQAAVAKDLANVNAFGATNMVILGQLGVKVWNANGSFVGMRNLIGELQVAYSKLTPEQQQNASTTLFGAQAASAMTGVIQGGTGAWDKYASDLARAGTAAQGGTTATHNLAGEWAELRNRGEAVAITLSKKMEPIMTNVIAALAQDMPTIGRDLTSAFDITVTVLGDVWNVLYPVFSFIISNRDIIIAFLVLWALRWTIIKGLNIGTEVLSWYTNFYNFINKPGGLKDLQSLLGEDANSGISGSLSRMKDQWGEMGNSGSRAMKDITAAAQPAIEAQQKLDQLIASGIDPMVAATAVKTLPKLSTADILKASPQTAFTGQATITEDFAKSIPELAAKLNPVMTDAGRNLMEAVAHAGPAEMEVLSDHFGTGVIAGLKGGLLELENANVFKLAGDAIGDGALTRIATGMADAMKGVPGLLKDSGVIASDVDKVGSGILGSIPGLGGLSKLANIGLQAGAQTVFVTNWPAGIGGGPGGIVNDVEKAAPSIVGLIRTGVMALFTPEAAGLLAGALAIFLPKLLLPMPANVQAVGRGGVQEPKAPKPAGMPDSVYNNPSGVARIRWMEDHGGLNNPQGGPPPPSKPLTVATDSFTTQWHTLSEMGVGTVKMWSGWQAHMNDTLTDVLQKGSNIGNAESDIALLIATGKITTAQKLGQYEDDWNDVQVHARDASDAQGIMATLIANGKLNAQTQVPAFVSAWNTLISEGMNPAAISAQDVATQMKLAASTAALLNAAFGGIVTDITGEQTGVGGLANLSLLGKLPVPKVPAKGGGSHGNSGGSGNNHHNTKTTHITVPVTHKNPSPAEIANDISWHIKYGGDT